jgi:hypothetical protein
MEADTFKPMKVAEDCDESKRKRLGGNPLDYVFITLLITTFVPYSEGTNSVANVSRKVADVSGVKIAVFTPSITIPIEKSTYVALQ